VPAILIQKLAEIFDGTHDKTTTQKHGEHLDISRSHRRSSPRGVWGTPATPDSSERQGYRI